MSVPLQKLKVLHIDDSEDFLILFKLKFAKELEILSLSDSTKTLDMLKKEKFDAVIADYEMSGLNGLDLLKKIKKEYPEIPVIIHTGQGSEKIARDAFLHGASDYFTKDIHEFAWNERLVNSIRKAISTIKSNRNKVERINHLNSILRSIRNVNQLITQVKDRTKLIKGACEKLVETRGFYGAWIVLLDENSRLLQHARENVGESFDMVLQNLEKGIIPLCFDCTRKNNHLCRIESRKAYCGDCPVNRESTDSAALTTHLKYNSTTYGYITVYLPTKYVNDKEETELFCELAGDISYALYTIELSEKHRVAEEKIRKSEEKFRKLFNSMTEGVCLHRILYDKEGKPVDYVILDVNESYEKIIGIKKEGAAEKRASQLYGTDNPPYLDIYATVAETGEPEYFETYFPPMDKHFNISIFSPQKGQFATVFSDITERKKTEEEKDKLNILLQAVLSQAPVGIFAVEGDTENFRILVENEESVRLLGQKLKGHENEIFNPDFKMAKFLQLDEKKEINLLDIPLVKVVNQKENISSEMYIRRINGKEIPIEVQAAPIFDKEGNIKGSLAIFWDITQRKMFENIIQKSEIKFRTLFDISADAIMIIDLEKGIIEVNKKAMELYQYNYQEFLKLSISDIDTPEESLFIGERKKKILKNGSLLFRTKHKKKDGTIFPVEVNTRLFEHEGKKAIIASCRDLTVRYEAEKALKQSEKRYQLLFDNAPLGMCTFNVEGNFLTANRAFQKLLGYNEEEIKSENIINITEENYHPKARQLLEDLVEGKIPYYDIEKKYIKKDGKTIDVFVWAVMIQDYNGNPLFGLAIAEDVSGKKKIEKQLLDRNRELNDFSYQVSHDLKGPINLLKGFTMGIKRDPNKFDDYSQRIINQTNKLLIFIDRILHLSRAGRIIGNKRNFPMEIIIQAEWGALYSPGMPMELILNKPLNDIYCDPGSFSQIYKNLFDNSIKYKDPNKEKLIIEVESKKEAGNVIISFKDNGIGIKKENLKKIFNPGFALDKDKGTGFGLAIIKKIIEAHDGTISAKSDGENTGVEFIMKLPQPENIQ